MSCDYHVFCMTCQDEHSFRDANRASVLMHHIVEHAAAIVALAPFLRDSPETVEFQVFYGSIDAAWFAMHLGHELVVRDEYGRVNDTCAKRFLCSGCQSPKYCQLEKAHAPPCSLRPHPSRNPQ